MGDHDLSANSLDGPSQLASSERHAHSENVETHLRDSPVLNLPTLLDMAAATWQTRRTPETSMHENCLMSGTSTQYLSQSFVDLVFSGVLKVAVLSVASASEKPLDERAAIRVIFKDRQAIVGLHGPHDGGKGAAYLWLHKGEEVASSTSLTFQHVQARSRKSLLNSTQIKMLSQVDLNSNSELSRSPTEAHKVVLPSSSKNGEQKGMVLQVEVSFVPLKEATATTGRMEDVGDGIHDSSKTSSVENRQEGINVGNLPALNEDTRANTLFQCAVELGRLFDFGFWRSGRGAEPVAYIKSRETNTELLVFWNPDTHQIAVAFESTRMTLVQDILTNIRIRPAIFDEAGERDCKRFRRFLRIFRGQRGCQQQLVHFGFLRAWRSVQPAVEGLIKQAAHATDNESFRSSDWKATFVGHSLGGSLATLATASAAANGWRPQQVAKYTFGAPRVGNQKFLDSFQAKVPESVRVFNNIDSFVNFPRSTGFLNASAGLSLARENRNDAALGVKLSFPDGEQRITVLPGQDIKPQLRAEWVVPSPKINNILDRTMHESKLLFNVATTRGLRIHETHQYIANLITVVRILASGAPGLSSEAQKELVDGLKEAQRLLNRFNKFPE